MENQMANRMEHGLTYYLHRVLRQGFVSYGRPHLAWLFTQKAVAPLLASKVGIFYTFAS